MSKKSGQRAVDDRRADDADRERLRVQPHGASAVRRERLRVLYLIGPVADVEDPDAGEADAEPLAVLEVPHRGAVQREKREEKRPARQFRRDDRADGDDGEQQRPDAEEESPSLLSRSDVTHARLILHASGWGRGDENTPDPHALAAALRRVLLIPNGR